MKPTSLVLMLLAFLAWTPLLVAADPDDGETAEHDVQAARLVYGEGKSAVCFSDAFLTLANEQAQLGVAPHLAEVQLAELTPDEHPFAIMTGEGGFTLTDAEAKRLKAYLGGGGFVLASAGCSSPTWAAGFRSMLRELYPEAELVLLEADHPAFHTVFDIGEVRHRKGLPRLPHLEALVLDGRVAAIFCPDGLNDTDAQSGLCCCCGGNEVDAAPQLNVNLLAYALQQPTEAEAEDQRK